MIEIHSGGWVVDAMEHVTGFVTWFGCKWVWDLIKDLAQGFCFTINFFLGIQIFDVVGLGKGKRGDNSGVFATHLLELN